MGKRTICILVMLMVVFVSGWSKPIRDTLKTGHRTTFVENKGQWEDRIRFASQLHNAAFFAERDCFTIAVREQAPTDAPFHHASGYNMHAYRIHFEGCNRDCTVEGAEKESSYNNYYIGNDPSKWAHHVGQYKILKYRELYPNIDLNVYSAEHALKYDFSIAPGGDVSQIVLRYEGADKLMIRDGELIVRTSVCDIVEKAPYAYQTDGEDTIEVAAWYTLKGSEVRLETGSYDHSKRLVIDPLLYFSTYTGSSADNWGTTATYDSYKNTYTAGLVFGIGYPTSIGAYNRGYNGNADIGIFKFDTTGSQQLFATYLGGLQADMPHSMYVNTFDELIIFGTTGSENFPTTEGAYDRTFNGGTEIAYLCFFNSSYYRDIYYPNGSDIFVSRFSSDGSALEASTYIGGSGNDGLNYRTQYNSTPATIMQGNDSLYFNYGDGARGEIITDDLNNVYIGSTTFSTDFPTSEGAVQPRSGGMQDGVVLKIDFNFHNLLWSTYLGGTKDDAVYSIDCDNQYNVVVCGGTNSTNFPHTPDSYQSGFGGGGADGFITKISYHGDQLMASTFLGSNAYDQCYFVRCGKNNDTYLFGQTKAQGSTMIHNATYGTPNSGMLLAHLTPNLDSLIWSTVFGTPNGQPNLSPTAFAADICGRVYAAGWGRDFVGYNDVQWNTAGTWNMSITPNAYQSNTDGQDFYILCIDNTASQLEYATYFGELHQNDSDGGTDHVDGGTSRFDRLATLYQSVCASCGGHDDFPTTPGAYSNSNESNNCNNALFRFNVHDDYPVAEFVAPPVGCAPYTINLHNTGRGDRYEWDFGDGATSTERNPTHTYNQQGEYTIRLVAHQPSGCKASDTMVRTIKVLGNGTQTAMQMACSGTRLQIGLTPRLGCSYRWIQGSVSDSNIANPYVEFPGTYIVLLTSSDNSCSEVDTFNVRFSQILDTLEVHNPSCPGGADGWVKAVAGSEVTGIVRYYWDGNEGDSILAGLTSDGHPHTLTLSDDNCTIERTFTLHDPLPPTIGKTSRTVTCDGCDGMIELSVSHNERHHYTFLWNDGDTNRKRENLCPGNYSVSISDSLGCTVQDTTPIVRDTLFDHVRVWADDTILFVGESTQLHATPLDKCNYVWQPTEGLGSPYSPNVTATPDHDITYSVTLTDDFGCEHTDTVRIHCIDVFCGESSVTIPNAFTPNSDGQNDQLCFSGEYITSFHIAIFTRWGELVYESNDIHECWDGRFRGNWCMPGVYVYTCHIRCEGYQESEIKGDITLIR